MEEQQPQSPTEPQAIAASPEKLAGGESGHASPGVHLRSKQTWFRIGVAIALLNPVLSGLLVGIFFWREPEMRREGKIITLIAIIWGAIVLAFVFANRAKGF